MLKIKNVQTPHGDITDLSFQNATSQSIDVQKKLIAFPAIIDTDIQFTSRQDPTQWQSQASTLLKSGISTIFDQNPLLPDEAQHHQQQVADTLNKQKSPLNILFFCNGTQPASFDKIGKNKQFFKGIQTSIDLASTPMPPFSSALDRIFQIAAQENLIVIIPLGNPHNAAQKQRNRNLSDVKHALALAEKYSAQVCFQHVQTKEELAAIKNTKEKGILIFTVVDFPHLFLTEKDIPSDILKTSNLFLPSPTDQQALWTALNDGSIDMLSSGIGLSPANDPLFAAKIFLPTMLQAYQEKKLRLDTLIAVTRVNAQNIFRIPPNDDVVLVDLNLTKNIASMATPQAKNDPLLAHWAKKELAGWPIHIIAKSQLISNVI